MHKIMLEKVKQGIITPEEAESIFCCNGRSTYRKARYIKIRVKTIENNFNISLPLVLITPILKILHFSRQFVKQERDRWGIETAITVMKSIRLSDLPAPLELVHVIDGNDNINISFH